MQPVRFERQYRTAYSEGYTIMGNEERLGRIELHYTPANVYCTLIVEREMVEDDIEELIEKIDDQLVMSADMPREDFVVSVYQGRDLGTYSDDYFGEEEGEGEEEEEEEEDL